MGIVWRVVVGWVMLDAGAVILLAFAWLWAKVCDDRRRGHEYPVQHRG